MRLRARFEQPRLLDAEVEPDDRDARHPEPAGGDEALVAADDDRVLAPGEDGLDEAPLADAAGQGLQLVLGDAPRVGGVGTELVDGDLLDGEGGPRPARHDSTAPAASSAAIHSARPSIGMMVVNAAPSPAGDAITTSGRTTANPWAYAAGVRRALTKSLPTTTMHS